jgi:leader peptidase (prepilin peptidase) / N-methyltransferase
MMAMAAPVTIVILALAFLLGLALGSFANVVIARVPQGGSILHPPSHCPSCGAPVRPRDNVPVASWIVLRGRCRDCGWRIPARYPLVELAGGLIALAIAAIVLALL